MIYKTFSLHFHFIAQYYMCLSSGEAHIIIIFCNDMSNFPLSVLSQPHFNANFALDNRQSVHGDGKF